MTVVHFPLPTESIACEGGCGRIALKTDLLPTGRTKQLWMCRWCKESTEGLAMALGLVVPCAAHACMEVGDAACDMCADDTLYCLGCLVEFNDLLICPMHARGD